MTGLWRARWQLRRARGEQWGHTQLRSGKWARTR